MGKRFPDSTRAQARFTEDAYVREPSAVVKMSDGIREGAHVTIRDSNDKIVARDDTLFQFGPDRGD